MYSIPNGCNTSSGSSIDLSKIVDLKNNQIIDGEKTFSQQIIANNGIQATGNIQATGDIRGNKVYNAVWNDFAEWFEKENINDNFEVGDICSWKNNGVIIGKKANKLPIVGVYSDSYGIILGGENKEDMQDNLKKFIPIGLAGRVKVKVLGKIKTGDFIKLSNVEGVGKRTKNKYSSNIVGVALESSNENGIKLINMLIK